MTLLGTPLLVVLGVAAVLLPVATLVLWPRTRGPRVVRTGSRYGMVLASQLAAVLLVAAAANDYGDFYTSWSDLVGGGQVDMNQASVVHAGAGAGPAGAVATRHTGQQPPPPRLRAPGTRGAAAPFVHPSYAQDLRLLGDTTFSTRTQWPTRGRVQSMELTGPQSGLSAPGYIYFPPQYFQTAYRHHRFPAVEVLTGYPGSTLGQVGPHQDYPGHALQSLDSHGSGPMIYVFMRSAVVPTRDTECTDIPGGPHAETYLAQDLPNVVNAALRTQPDNWGLLGDSTGGYCTTKILMAYPQTFHAGVSLSGYYHTLSDPTTGDLWGGKKVLEHLNSPEWVMKHQTPPPVSLMVTISKTEATYPDTVKFLRLVKPPMKVTAVILPTGGHNFTTWGAEMPAALHFLSTHLGA